VIIYVTTADGFGEDATDEDRDSFCSLVERRVEETYEGYECRASWGGGALESEVTVESDECGAPDEGELLTWIGVDLWDEWCSGARVILVPEASPIIDSQLREGRAAMANTSDETRDCLGLAVHGRSGQGRNSRED
jgi:hypothetical protein